MYLIQATTWVHLNRRWGKLVPIFDWDKKKEGLKQKKPSITLSVGLSALMGYSTHGLC